MSKDELSIESEIQSKGLTARRITPEIIDEQIVGEAYFRGTDGVHRDSDNIPLSCLTICVLVLKNGFTIVGKSACASPENYDSELGRKIARDDARNQIWAFEGYALRSCLAASR